MGEESSCRTWEGQGTVKAGNARREKAAYDGPSWAKGDLKKFFFLLFVKQNKGIIES